MQRISSPEYLDSLPHDHPDAIHSRRDLRWINFLMGNFYWIRNILRKELQSSDHCLEIGAGVGDLGYFLLQDKHLSVRLHFTGLDICPSPAHWAMEWHQQDVFTYHQWQKHTIVIANLFLHGLTDDQLKILGQKIQNSPIRLLISNDPARARLHHYQLKLLHLIGLNSVTIHDGKVSINAGFQNQELPHLLGFSPSEWKIQLHTTYLGAYRMVAKKT